MALTQAQRSSVRRYLGYSGRYLNFDTILEQAMDLLSSNAADEALAVELIGNCDAVMAEIESTVPKVSKAGAVGSLQLDGAKTLQTLRGHGNGYVSQLSNLLGVPIRNGGAFSTGGSDGYAGYSGPNGGGNRLRYG